MDTTESGFFKAGILAPVRVRGEGDLVAIGGDLTPKRLMAAYSSGIFPWYEEDSPVLWWSPEARAVVELDQFNISRRLARTIRGGKFEITFDRDFRGVMEGCARERRESTWITRDMIEAYTGLHKLGFAHSVEAWRDGQLVGGVYGVRIGGFFSGESMFYRERDASKVALSALVSRLRERGFLLFDVQILNDHTSGLGAVEIPRAIYLRRLRRAVRQPVKF